MFILIYNENDLNIKYINNLRLSNLIYIGLSILLEYLIIILYKTYINI